MTRTTQRIVVVLQGPPTSAASFEPVLRIARRTEARIEGVFVEDSRMIELAALPASRFIHAQSYTTSAMDEGVVRRALRVTSVRTEQALAARVTETAIPWSFTSRRCAVLSDAFGEASPGDLVVVTLQRDGSNTLQVAELVSKVTDGAAVSLLVLNERGAPASSILVLFDGDADDLEAALDLAHNFECPMRVLTIATEAERGTALAAQAHQILDAAQHPATVDTLIYSDTGELDHVLHTDTPGTLVVDRKGDTAKTLNIAALLATSQISLYLRN